MTTQMLCLLFLMEYYDSALKKTLDLVIQFFTLLIWMLEQLQFEVNKKVATFWHNILPDNFDPYALLWLKGLLVTEISLLKTFNHKERYLNINTNQNKTASPPPPIFPSPWTEPTVYFLPWPLP